jgi:predicted O-methyltransferase YrrM
VEIVNERIEDYLRNLYGERDEVLKEMEAEAKKLDFPIVGPLVGKLLYQLAKMVNARRILEMGSGYGYSAFWWALAMNAEDHAGGNGEIFLTEGSETNKKKGEAYLERAGLLMYSKYYVGDALEIVDKISGEFDVVFIDIEKQQYPAALAKAVKRIRHGGLLVADNALRYGRVVEAMGDAATEAIKEFNRRVFSMNEFAASIVPVRDGVMVAYKI